MNCVRLIDSIIDRDWCVRLIPSTLTQLMELGCSNLALGQWVWVSLKDLHELGSSAPLKQLRMGLKLKHQTNSVISIARGSWLFEPRSSSMCVSLTFVIRTNLDHRLLESIVERAWNKGRIFHFPYLRRTYWLIDSNWTVFGTKIASLIELDAADFTFAHGAWLFEPRTLSMCVSHT